MKSVRKENFIKLIKSAEPQNPAVDFTRSVMDEISADLKNKTVINRTLKTLLRQQSVEKAPGNITSNVMSQIVSMEKKRDYVPLISNKAWCLTAAFTVMMFVVLIGSTGTTLVSTPRKPDNMGYIDSVIHAVPPIYLFILIIISVLLYLDYIINSWISISKLRTNRLA